MSVTARSFDPTLDELRSAVDEDLHAFLRRHAAELPENSELIDELWRMISAGGKRLRPAFCYWGYRAGGGQHTSQIVGVAGGLELLHTFALVHDDIMDTSDERRGQPTVHALHGIPVAVLAGDLALVLADSCLLESGFDAEQMGRAMHAYQMMRQEVIAGQYLDVRAEIKTSMTENEARRIAVLKSGRYSIEKPLIIGACLAGATDEVVSHLAAAGEPLGEAFQFRDDLLGTFGERAATGKPVDSDIREGKRNLLYALTLSSLSGDERAFFVEKWGGGASLTEAEVGDLRALIETSGARAGVEALTFELAEVARAHLQDAPIEPEPRAALLSLADLAINRLV
ncbi:MAG: polyprenyl synthetase family protein [Actinomycetota bacterium]|nr:polyprenyl synthetase family protein [Actinomycetota bacterium]